LFGDPGRGNGQPDEDQCEQKKQAQQQISLFPSVPVGKSIAILSGADQKKAPSTKIRRRA
jgi:hypothetical protein